MRLTARQGVASPRRMASMTTTSSSSIIIVVINNNNNINNDAKQKTLGSRGNEDVDFEDLSFSEEDILEIVGNYSIEGDSEGDSSRNVGSSECSRDSCSLTSGDMGSVSSESTRAVSLTKKKRTRAKRGGFKKGFLKKRKGLRRTEIHKNLDPDISQDQAYDEVTKATIIEPSDCDLTRTEIHKSLDPDNSQDQQAYDEVTKEVFIEPSDYDGDTCHSTADTVPTIQSDNEDIDKQKDLIVDNSAAEGGEELKETCEKEPSSPLRRRKKGIGIARKKKYSWRSVKHDTLEEISNSPQGKNSGQRDDTSEGHPTDETIGKPQEKPDGRGTEQRGVGVCELDLTQHNMPSAAVSSVEGVLWIASCLKLTLDSYWTVSTLQNGLSISKIANNVNPCVERSITLIKDEVNIFVLRKRIERDHAFWKFKATPDWDNLGAVVDYLTLLACRLMRFKICSAVREHQDAWEAFAERKNGHVEDYFDVSAIRSVKCKILTVGIETCGFCRHLYYSLVQHKRRRSKSDATDSNLKKTNNRYLLQSQLEKKLKLIAKEKRRTKEDVRRLKQRVQKLLQEKSVSVNEEFGKDFANILNDNTDKMTELEKIFWQQQAEALKKRGAASRTMRWHPAMIRLALHLRMLSPSGYDFLRGIITLPSERRLYDYSQFTDIKEGVQQDLLEHLQGAIAKECCSDSEKYFSLLLDEMSIRSDLVYSSRTGELIGYTNLSSMESSMRELQAEMEGKTYEKRLAKKVLVFMLNGAVNNIQFVPAVFSTDDLSAAQLYMRTWDVIYAVEEAGAKVLTVIFDGASVNRKFITMNFNAGDKAFIHKTKNTASGESRDLYFMLDPPHLIKTFRNCLANSYSHRQSRRLWKDGQHLSWKAIEALYEITKNDKFKTTKLTKAHIYLTSFSCMKVSLSSQVLSRSVAEALVENKDVSPLKEVYSEELVKLIRLLNKTFDCLNGSTDSKKKETNKDLEAYVSAADPRFEFLELTFLGFLSDWEKSISRRAGKFSKQERSRMIISHQTLEGFKITIASFVQVVRFLLSRGSQHVSARKFNQDPLEQYFSTQRRARGSDDNPTLKQVLHTRLSLQAQGQGIYSSGRKGNTEVLKRPQDNIDDSPLPVRKKKKL
ncbi:Transposable element P transposase [Frankliniella fusca]|uniref:Transposable element P transposase n=1 Tax=Frankliniella fusca TaxID=407009 RepID=A0AAE1LB33_9NEOP|nr:Transposable element P transposase [Frankliniella fusca]